MLPTLANKSSVCAGMGAPGIGGIIPGGGIGPPDIGPPCMGVPNGGTLKSAGLGKCMPSGFTGLLNVSDIGGAALRVLLGMSANELLDVLREVFFFNAAI
jgi:hypothetical protein